MTHTVHDPVFQKPIQENQYPVKGKIICVTVFSKLINKNYERV